MEERKRYVGWESEVRAFFLTFSDDQLFIGELASDRIELIARKLSVFASKPNFFRVILQNRIFLGNGFSIPNFILVLEETKNEDIS
ncbi:MAG: hypothetical protein GQ523_01315 [Methanophagales archaeon]|nr:hypothetical protein [Methanophagales archaeon]